MSTEWVPIPVHLVATGLIDVGYSGLETLGRGAQRYLPRTDSPLTDSDSGEESDEELPFLMDYTVFNIEQTESLPVHLYHVTQMVPGH